MRAALSILLLACLPGLASAAAPASAAKSAVRIQVESPRPGEPVTNKVDQAPIRGNAMTAGDKPAEFDVMLVIDVSGSTKVASGSRRRPRRRDRLQPAARAARAGRVSAGHRVDRSERHDPRRRARRRGRPDREPRQEPRARRHRDVLGRHGSRDRSAHALRPAGRLARHGAHDRLRARAREPRRDHGARTPRRHELRRGPAPRGDRARGAHRARRARRDRRRRRSCCS